MIGLGDIFKETSEYSNWKLVKNDSWAKNDSDKVLKKEPKGKRTDVAFLAFVIIEANMTKATQ
jgi:hypothetical protein